MCDGDLEELEGLGAVHISVRSDACAFSSEGQVTSTWARSSADDVWPHDQRMLRDLARDPQQGGELIGSRGDHGVVEPRHGGGVVVTALIWLRAQSALREALECSSVS